MQSSASCCEAGVAPQGFWREEDTVQVTRVFVSFSSLRLLRWPSLVPTELMLLVRKE